MVISVLVNLESFGPKVVQTVDDANAAEDLLQALIDNGCLTLAPGETVRDLIGITDRMPTLTGQRIQILVGEVITRSDCIEAKGFPAVPKDLPSCKRLRALAEHAKPNIAVYATDAEKQSVEAAGNPDIEICPLSRYRESNAERLRKMWWNDSPALDQLDTNQRRFTLLHAIRYSMVLVVADRMIARQLKQNDFKGLEESIRGIAWLVDIWTEGSPLASRHLPTIRVVSQGGPTPGQGYIDPASTKAELERRIKAATAHVAGLRVEVILKADSSPSIFMDRYIRANNRTFLIRHGISQFGVLAAEEGAAGNAKTRTPTYIHRCENSSANDLDRILELPDA